jgi:metal-dependent amidase/aminoacylase/carboxypeptidase family protein
MSSTSNPAAAVLGGLSACRSWQENLYRDIHQHPELSHQEHRTAKLVAEMLRGSGYEVREGIGGTGVVGVMRNGSGPTVLMRADMDALPVLPRARREVVSGIVCGTGLRHRHGRWLRSPGAHRAGIRPRRAQ